MVKIKIYIALLFVVISSSSHAGLCSEEVSVSEELLTSEKDVYYVLFTSIVDIDKDRNTFIDKNGVRKIDRIKKFSELESAYTRVGVIVENCPDNIKYLKLMMMFAFDAIERNNSGTGERLAQDMLFAYHRNPTAFVSAMKEMSFATVATCKLLNAHFDIGWADTPYTKFEFKNHFKKVGLELLGADSTRLCLERIK